MIEWQTLVSAFIIGLLGAGHCFAMCGGISAALSFAVSPADNTGANKTLRLDIIGAYNIGRITSYTVIGGLSALAVSLFGIDKQSSGLRLIAGLLLILMGLYLANIWRALVWLERAGGYVWQYIQPMASRLLPVRNVSSAMLLGVLWGWLPCGLVYTALTYSAAQANAVEGAIVMLFFGLGTLPAVLTGGIAARLFKQFFLSKGVRLSMAFLLVLFGIWTWFGVYSHRMHHHDGQTPESALQKHHHHH